MRPEIVDKLIKANKMTETEKQKAEQMAQRMLNEYGISQLVKIGIYRKLIESLSIEDLQTLVRNKIYFNPLFSPASQTELKYKLDIGTKIITIDINTLKLFTTEEGTAIILHEIGHALNPNLKQMEGEYMADNYASERGFKNEIISSLEKGKIIRPSEFVTESTELRIKKLRING
jgi:hypothetical protein